MKVNFRGGRDTLTVPETISTYTKFFPEEHLRVSRNLDPFTDTTTDTRLQMR